MRPTLFSEKFGISGDKFDEANLLDPYIDTDTPLFVDPLLIDKSTNQLLRTKGLTQFRDYLTRLSDFLQCPRRRMMLRGLVLRDC
jgi:hypothetical protein